MNFDALALVSRSKRDLSWDDNRHGNIVFNIWGHKQWTFEWFYRCERVRVTSKSDIHNQLGKMGRKVNDWCSAPSSLNNCHWEDLDPHRVLWSWSAARSQTLWLCWAAPRCEFVKLYECESGSSWKSASMCCIHSLAECIDEWRSQKHHLEDKNVKTVTWLLEAFVI